MACASTSSAGDIQEIAAISQNSASISGRRRSAWNVAVAASANTKSAEPGAKSAYGPRARKQNTKSREKKSKTRGEKRWEKQTYYRPTPE